MSEFSRFSLVILGLLCLIGAIYQFVELWPDIESNTEFVKYIDEYTRLLQEGKQREASSLFQKHDLSEALKPVQKVAAMYWAAAGIVSWIILWGLASIIGELTRIRSALLQRASGRTEPRSF